MNRRAFIAAIPSLLMTCLAVKASEQEGKVARVFRCLDDDLCRGLSEKTRGSVRTLHTGASNRFASSVFEDRWLFEKAGIRSVFVYFDFSSCSECCRGPSYFVVSARARESLTDKEWRSVLGLFARKYSADLAR